jgi:hypothetical protein
LNANKSAHFTAPYEPKYNDNPSPDKYQPDQTKTVVTELPRAQDRNERKDIWIDQQRISKEQPENSTYTFKSTFEYNEDGASAPGGLNSGVHAHFTGPHEFVANQNPCPTKYQPDQSATVITEKPRAADRNERKDVWMVDQREVAGRQAEAGRYEAKSTFVYTEGGKSTAGGLNSGVHAHFTSPYEFQANGNPSPDKYRPDHSQVLHREPSANVAQNGRDTFEFLRETF